jgi:hypothetical protein
MHTREYHVEDMPEHSVVENALSKIKSMFGVHSAHVDRDSQKLVVHATDDGVFPGIEQSAQDLGFASLTLVQ